MKSIASLTEQLHSRLTPARVWFEQREPREQMALRILAIAVVLTLLWLLIWKPLQHGHQSAVDDYQRNARLKAWIEDNSNAVRGAVQTKASVATGADWIAQLSRSADASGVVLRGFSPEGEQTVRVQIEAQPFAEVLSWLQQLENEQGVRVANAEFSSTSSPGLINLRATLKRAP
jgi:general secretion pathway protein M